MGKLLWAEWKELRGNRAFWLLAGILVGLSLLYVEMQFSSRELDPVLVQKLGISSDPEERGKDAFWQIMRDPSVVAWFSIPFAALLIGPGFTRRSISAQVMAGHSRLRVFCLKAGEYYLLFPPVLAVYPVGAMLRSCRPWLENLSAADTAYFWQAVVLKTMLDLGLISVCFFFVFLCRDVVKTLAVTVGYTFFLSFLSRFAGKGLLGKLLYFLPLAHYSHLVPHPDPLPGTLWDVPPIGRQEMLVIVAGSAVILIASLAGAYALFRRADLK